jgi:C1A family cysteine protease
MADEGLSIQSIRAAIERAGAQWEAGTTSLSVLSTQEQRRRLGAVPPPGEMSIEELERALASRGPALAVRAIGAPAAYDLRNVNGVNYITSVKDQGGCGSCVAFGVVAAIEGRYRRQRNDGNLAVDLSEAQLFYCYGRQQGRNCGNGWWPDQALECVKTGGLADEGSYPYTAGDQNCTNLASDWQTRAIKITGEKKMTSSADMKTWISTRGPLTACFIVYDDFFAYRSGIYRHVSGGQAGGHCVSIVGYDDNGGFWICKNSWGTSWGEAGFFCIAYGECGIDTWLVNAPLAVEETGWLSNRHVIGLWTVDQDRNAWAYLDGGVAWRRIAYDNDNIFANMLTELATAKAVKRPVNVFQEQGVIKQVYVL